MKRVAATQILHSLCLESRNGAALRMAMLQRAVFFDHLSDVYSLQAL
jgi:hypothetical protein